jgi:RNA recognition motif-containing protein
MVKLFIGGFPLEMEEIELAKLFAVHGDINTIKIVRNKITRVCKGYAFIEMTDRAGAENAVSALNGTLMTGKILTVNINEEPTLLPDSITAAPVQTYVPTYQNLVKLDGEQRKKRPRITV